MENFRDRIIKKFEPEGIKFFTETIWSSSLQKTDLPKINTFLKKNNFFGIDASLASPHDGSTSRYTWTKHYTSSGQCVSVSTPIPIPSESNHLKLTFGYSDRELRNERRLKILVAVNSLRLIFGVPVARELLLTSFFGEKEEQVTYSDEGFASFFDTQSINIFKEPPIEDAEVISISEEAAFLLEKAFSQEFPNERFILMWLAFEAIINAKTGKGINGQKRQSFFKDELQSEIANEEVRRLFNLRCQIFKEGGVLNTNIENDCWSLYSAIQLATLKDCEQRRAFLFGYETQIIDNVYKRKY